VGAFIFFINEETSWSFSCGREVSEWYVDDCWRVSGLFT